MVIWLEIAWFKLLWIVTLSSSVTYKSTSLSTLFTLHKYKYFFWVWFSYFFFVSLCRELYTCSRNILQNTLVWIVQYILIWTTKNNWSYYTCFFKATHAASIAENFFGMFTGKRLPYFFDTIPFLLHLIKPMFISTTASEFGAFLLFY